MQTIIGWLAFGLCVTGNTMVILKKRYGYLVWFIGTGIWTTFALMRGDYPQFAMFLVYEALNLWGFFKWKGIDKT